MHSTDLITYRLRTSHRLSARARAVDALESWVADLTHAALDDSFALLQIGVVDAGLGSGVGYGCGGGGDREGQGCEEVGEEHGWMWVSLGFFW